MTRKTSKAARDKKFPGKIDLTGWTLTTTDTIGELLSKTLQQKVLQAAEEAIQCATIDGAFVRLYHEEPHRNKGRIPISLSLPLATEIEDEPSFQFTLEEVINDTLDDLDAGEIDTLIEELQWLAARVERWRTALKAQAA